MQYERKYFFLFQNVCNKNHKYEYSALKVYFCCDYYSVLILIDGDYEYFLLILIVL